MNDLRNFFLVVYDNARTTGTKYLHYNTHSIQQDNNNVKINTVLILYFILFLS
jgi:hypothetical protein